MKGRVKTLRSNSRKLVMLRGLPGSGKSTYAKKYAEDVENSARINFDLLREMLHFGVHSSGREKLVKQVASAVAKALFDGGSRVVVMDNTGLSKSQIDLCTQIAADNKAELEVEDFTGVDINVCINRDLKRGDKAVGEKVIRKFWNDYLRPPNGHAGHDLSLPQCVIVDLDGTVFDHGGGRSPYDGDKVYDDEVRDHVATVVRLLAADGIRVVFVSGREDIGKCRSETIRCIEDKLFGVDRYELYMRNSGDHRKDYVVKAELYDKCIKGRYDVFAVMDDRASVVEKCWDELGFGDRIFRVGRIHGDDF